VPTESAIQRATADYSFIDHVATLIVELHDTEHIAAEWHRYASTVRARHAADTPEAHAELASLLVAILNESHWMALWKVTRAAQALAGALESQTERSGGSNTEDKLGNFEIQTLMSEYNEAMTYLFIGRAIRARARSPRRW
jgi:hypothetical protein